MNNINFKNDITIKDIVDCLRKDKRNCPKTYNRIFKYLSANYPIKENIILVDAFYDFTLNCKFRDADLMDLGVISNLLLGICEKTGKYMSDAGIDKYAHLVIEIAISPKKTDFADIVNTLRESWDIIAEIPDPYIVLSTIADLAKTNRQYEERARMNFYNAISSITE